MYALCACVCVCVYSFLSVCLSVWLAVCVYLLVAAQVYRRDLEEGGVVVDPFKAYHTVSGITAYELCQAFYDEKCRMDWESEWLATS